MSVKFYLSDYRNRMGECPIRVSVCVHGQRFVSTVGMSVHPSNWVNDPSLPVSKGRWVRADTVNSSGASAIRINNKLRRVVRHFEEWEPSAPDYPDKPLLRLELLYALGKKRRPDPEQAAREEKRFLIGAYDEYLACRPKTRQWAPETLKAHRTLRGHLINGFGSKTLDYFNEDGLNAFIHYLRYDKKMKENTIRKVFSSFKSFLNWAYEKHYTKVDSVRYYCPRFVLFEKPVIHLDKDELHKLWNLEMPADGEVITLKDKEGQPYEKVVLNHDTLDKARDLFLFQCMTSLRYDDLSSVRWSNIRDNKLCIVTGKTRNPVVIELNRYANFILDKYRAVSLPFDVALPPLTNQEMNRALKVISQLCGFDDPVTFTYSQAGKRIEETMPKYQCIGTHNGRKTFISLALSEGIPTQVVRHWSGHRSEEAMQPYIAITDKARIESMNMYESGLNLDE